MIQLSEKNKMYLAVSIFLALLITFFSLIITPLMAKIKNDSRLLTEKKSSLESLFQSWKKLEDSKKTYQKIQKELAGLPFFLQKNDAIKFIMSLENMARQTNNEQNITLLNPSGKKTENEPINMQVSLKGAFPDLIKFLILLENGPYFNDINSIQISRQSSIGETETGNNIINSTINISAYQN